MVSARYKRMHSRSGRWHVVVLQACVQKKCFLQRSPPGRACSSDGGPVRADKKDPFGITTAIDPEKVGSVTLFLEAV